MPKSRCFQDYEQFLLDCALSGKGSAWSAMFCAADCDLDLIKCIKETLSCTTTEAHDVARSLRLGPTLGPQFVIADRAKASEREKS